MGLGFEPELESLRKSLMAGETGPYSNILSESMSYSAQMRMEETLQMDCDRHIIGGEWATGERERLTKDFRFLTKEDVALLRNRLKGGDQGITREELLDGLENTFVWCRTWTRDTGHLWQELYLLKGDAPKSDDIWDWRDY